MSGLMKFVITGPIGAGKTSVLRIIQAFQEVSMVRPEFRNRIEVILEDVDEWAYLLRKNYEERAKAVADGVATDGSGTAVLFQLKVLSHYLSVTERLMKLEETQQPGESARLVLIERSPLDVLNIFLKTNEEAGIYSGEQFDALVKTTKVIAGAPQWAGVHYLVLDAKEPLCSSRVRERQRDGEDKVDKAYMEKIEQAYGDFLGDLGTQRATRIAVEPGMSPTEVAGEVLRIIYKFYDGAN